MDFKKILKEAQAAGMKALKECVPTPVSWVQSDLSNKPIGKPSKPDPDGEMGGAYLYGIEKRSEFARWAKANTKIWFSDGHRSGLEMHLSYGTYKGQSAEKKEAFARAFAKVLTDNGIKCYVKTYLS